MAFAQAAIEEHGEQYVMLMAHTQTMKNVLERRKELDYPSAATWIVVHGEGEAYQVIRLSSLQRMLWDDNSVLKTPLGDLGLPDAGLVITQDTEDYGTGELLAQVEDEAGFTLVITNDDGLAGLLTNPTMGGGMDKLELVSWEGACKSCECKIFFPNKKPLIPGQRVRCDDCAREYLIPDPDKK